MRKVFVLFASLMLPWASQAQENILCFTSDGSEVACGGRWTEVQNGVTYSCYCNCPYPASCSPVSSGSSSYGSSGSLESSLAPVFEQLFDNLFQWLFSPSAPSPQRTQQPSQRDQKAAEEAYRQQQEEYKAKALKQLSDAKDEFTKQNNARFLTQQLEAASDMKDRVAKAEATKAVKQANCAAFAGIELVKQDIYDFSDFDNLVGDAEQQRSAADFTNGIRSDCPEVNIQIPEVTAAIPVSFQEHFYTFVTFKADSIKSTVVALKAQKVKNDQVIEEKKKVIQEAEKVIEERKSAPEDDALLKAAMELEADASEELMTAQETDQKMIEEIALKEKEVTALDKMRSTFDKPKKTEATGQTTIK